MPALCIDEDDDYTYPSWQSTGQQPTAAANGLPAGASSTSTSSNLPAPREYVSVPATLDTSTTSAVDTGFSNSAPTLSSSRTSLDITTTPTTSLDIGATDTCMSTQWNKLCNTINRSRRIIKSGPRRILLLCAGPDDRFDGLTQLIKAAGFESENYDTANGAHLDLTDDSVSDPLAARVAGGEFVAAFASPDCSTYSKLHNLPGPPPLRDVEGTGRYGKAGLKPKQQERVRRENIVASKVAEILELFTALWLPWIFEAPEASPRQVSILNLDEFRTLAGRPGVQRVKGVQCPFEGLSSKETAWLHFNVDLADMPSKCNHPLTSWYNQQTGEKTIARHRPTRGKATFGPSPPTTATMAITPSDYVSESLAAYPALLNRYLVAKLGASQKRHRGHTTRRTHREAYACKPCRTSHLDSATTRGRRPDRQAGRRRSRHRGHERYGCGGRPLNVFTAVWCQARWGSQDSLGIQA